ncbi:MAG: DEAD/DEAH box helicase [Bacteroidales bacterium]|nr:DEAD/DEAH box helicase [Bacteroidales bacterium]
MPQNTFNPGKLVRYRDRRWIVLPSDDQEVMVLKPLGGSDHEITGVFRPLELPGEIVDEDSFPRPTPDDLGSFNTAKLLFDASRLSFRNASGPFRCMGKLSFRPRAYQIVPLVMALKQEITRLLVADDVGIGKTIEALLILKELLERGEIKTFAVICPPHLCDQWQNELRDKLDIRAEIIRSSTAAQLDRKLRDDRSIFYHVPYQVISIDYIKFEKRKMHFLTDAPDLIIVDEAHTCALPANARNKNQQMRHSLVSDLAEDENKHIVLLTATPHSGKDSEFVSLMGLLNNEFKSYKFDEIGQKHREAIARHFIQRKRKNIKLWLEEETPFPEREAGEEKFYLSPEYLLFYEDVRRFARAMTREGQNKRTARVRYWAALALLRGVMSSPAAGLDMLQNRQNRRMDEEELLEAEHIENPVMDKLSQDTDFTRAELLDKADLVREELDEIKELAGSVRSLFGTEKDLKAKKAIGIIESWLKQGFHPIVFCKYIETANYIGKILRDHLPGSVDVRIITSVFADEQRKEQIELMGQSDKRVLVATDCLSEGINLQDYFTAVLHYDLPWNPNRIEQRDGRIDRFGQDAGKVKTYLLIGEDNQIDKLVLKVLVKKVWDIQKSTGVNISLGDNEQSVMDEVLRELLMGDGRTGEGKQMSMFAEEFFTHELEQARLKAENLRSIFAHASIKPELIRDDLKAVDEAIGDVKTVEAFVIQSVTHLGATLVEDGPGYMLYPRNLPNHLKDYFGDKEKVKISFESPTPKGYRYIGRNHLFVEQLCRFMFTLAFEPHTVYHRVARVAEIITRSVDIKTTLIMFRVRNVIKEVRSCHEVVSEEMYLWGYQGSGTEARSLGYGEAKQLLNEAESILDISPERQKADFEAEIRQFITLEPEFIELATRRAENLVEAHGRFKELVGGRRYEKATPVLPPDVMGVYILMPKPKLEV